MFFFNNRKIDLTDKVLGKGCYGSVIETKETSSSIDINHSLVVKKISLNFYTRVASQHPLQTPAENMQIALTQFMSAYVLTLHEAKYFDKCNDFPGELFYNPADMTLRLVMLKLPGIPLNQYYFSTPLEYLLVWIKILVETHYLHTRRRVIHNEIKFANILIDLHQNIRFCDFGFARSIGERTAGCRDEQNFHLHPILNNQPPPLSSEHLDNFSLGQLHKDFMPKNSMAELATRQTIYEWLKPTHAGMTNTNFNEQWTLEKAFEEAVSIYNLHRPKDTPEMSSNWDDHKPSPPIEMNSNLDDHKPSPSREMSSSSDDDKPSPPRMDQLESSENNAKNIPTPSDALYPIDLTNPFAFTDHKRSPQEDFIAMKEYLADLFVNSLKIRAQTANEEMKSETALQYTLGTTAVQALKIQLAKELTAAKESQTKSKTQPTTTSANTITTPAATDTTDRLYSHSRKKPKNVLTAAPPKHKSQQKSQPLNNKK